MSVVTYNGVTLPYAQITQFAQDAIGDDVSNTDFVLTKFDIKVTCIINANYLNELNTLIANGQPVTDNAALIMDAIRQSLLERRKQLSVTMNGRELIPQNQVGANPTATVDAQNGPIPQSCFITDLTNVTFILHYHIIAHYWEKTAVNAANSNPVTNERGNNVLYNRWTETVELDDCQISTRTREGKFAIRSDNFEGKVADEVRSQFAVLSCPQGFLRQSANYVLAPDGLALQYRIVDKEQFKMPPVGAFKAEGQYIETGTNGGALRIGMAWVRLKGNNDVFKQAFLMQQAVAIAASKILLAGGALNKAVKGVSLAGVPNVGIGGFAILRSVVCTVNMYENEVECRMEVTLRANQQRISGAVVTNPNMCYTPFTDNRPDRNPPPYKDRGTANLLLRAAAYYDPSLTDTQLNKITGQMTRGREPGQEGANP